MEDLHSLIEKHFSYASYNIPVDYTWKDLWKYKCFKLRTSRLKKKFQKNPKKYISSKLRRYLSIMALGKIFAEEIIEISNREGFARKLLTNNFNNKKL